MDECLEMSIELTKGFNSTSELKKLDHDNDLNILMGGDGISNRRSLQAIISHHRVTLEKKRKEFIERILVLTYQQILKKIYQAQLQISDAVNRMVNMINQVDEKITQINKALQDMTRRHQELNDVIEARYFEKEGDSKYKSKAVADTLTAYDQRRDKKITDNITPEILIQILKSQVDFEKTMIVPALEDELVELHSFRDGVQGQKEDFEKGNKQIDDAISIINADNSMSDQERRIKKIELLEQVSKTVLDAQMAAHTAESEYLKLVAELQEERYMNNDALYKEHTNEESLELNQSALEELQTIKPILTPMP